MNSRLSKNDTVNLGGAANLAVLGGNLPPSRTRGDRPPFRSRFVRTAVGRVARQNGPVARSTRNSIESLPVSLFLIACFSFLPFAASFAADKSSYHLFNPTPRELMREMSTDRPDKTESPYTVDAGHFQIEMDVLNYSYDRYNPERQDIRVESVSIAPINLKAGLCNNVDLQLVVETYTSVRIKDRETPSRSRHQGFGDITPRLKVNLWGNDGGPTALAVMPYLKLPANQDDLGNNSVEGGVILPLAVELPRGFGMGVMTQFDFIRDEADGGHHAEFVNSITFSRDIVGNLGGYVEFFSAVSAETDSDWVGTLDLGLTYGLTEDIQLDAGVNFGVTRSADDISPFLGIAWRF